MPRVIDNLDNRCMLCGARASFGFGLPPRKTVWACRYHRAKLDAEWVPSLYSPLPRRPKGVSARRQPVLGQGTLV
jgi:hypothetical protein